MVEYTHQSVHHPSKNRSLKLLKPSVSSIPASCSTWLMNSGVRAWTRGSFWTKIYDFGYKGSPRDPIRTIALDVHEKNSRSSFFQYVRRSFSLGSSHSHTDILNPSDLRSSVFSLLYVAVMYMMYTTQVRIEALRKIKPSVSSSSASYSTWMMYPMYIDQIQVRTEAWNC